MPVPFPKDYPFPKSSPLAAASAFSPELIARISHLVQVAGLTERRAAFAAGLYPETLRAWKREHPEIIPLLAGAPPASPPRRSKPSPATPRPPGRPSLYSPQLADFLCELVRLHGLTDSRAALHHGLPRNTISYWKRVHPDFAARLRQARAEFHATRLANLPPLPEPPPNAGWRYHLHLLGRACPSEFGRRRRSSPKPRISSHLSENPSPDCCTFPPLSS